MAKETGTPRRGTEGKYDNGLAEDLESLADSFAPGPMTVDDHVAFGRALREAKAGTGDRAALRAKAARACHGDRSQLARFDAIRK